MSVILAPRRVLHTHTARTALFLLQSARPSWPAAAAGGCVAPRHWWRPPPLPRPREAATNQLACRHQRLTQRPWCRRLRGHRLLLLLLREGARCLCPPSCLPAPASSSCSKPPSRPRPYRRRRRWRQGGGAGVCRHVASTGWAMTRVPRCSQPQGCGGGCSLGHAAWASSLYDRGGHAASAGWGSRQPASRHGPQDCGRQPGRRRGPHPEASTACHRRWRRLTGSETTGCCARTTGIDPGSCDGSSWRRGSKPGTSPRLCCQHPSFPGVPAWAWDCPGRWTRWRCTGGGGLCTPGLRCGPATSGATTRTARPTFQTLRIALNLALARVASKPAVADYRELLPHRPSAAALRSVELPHGLFVQHGAQIWRAPCARRQVTLRLATTRPCCRV